MGTLLHSCVEVRETIELSFGVVSGISLGIRVLDGVQMPQEAVSGFFAPHQFKRDIFCTEM